MKRSCAVPTLVMAAMLTMAAACSPVDEPRTEAEAPLVFDGVFVPEEASAGGIDELEFRGARYRLLADGCTDLECEEQGSFERDAARAELRLVPDRSGVPYTIPLEVDDAEATEETETESVPNADAFTPILGVIGSTEHGNIAPTNTQRLLERRGVRLVRRVKLKRSRYTKREGGCSAQQIRAAQAACSNDGCAGRQSRGLNYCTASGGRASYSCACSTGSTGSGGACRRAQTNFLRCMDLATVRGCGYAADCRGDFINATDSLNGCGRPTVRGGCAGY